MPFVPPPHVAAAPIVGRFWCYQPVVAPNYEPNESRNPPSAAYASQDTPGRKAQALQVVDDNNSIRSLSPTPHTVEQTRSMNLRMCQKAGLSCNQAACIESTDELLCRGEAHLRVLVDLSSESWSVSVCF